MSVEAQNAVSETPVSKVVPTTEQPDAQGPKPTETPAVAEATVAAAVTSDDAAPAPATENPTGEGSTVVGAVPASEGVLGYKEHGFLKSLRYSKNFFWFGEEPSTSESLAHFIKTEKGNHVHHAAAWAQETGNGVLFYAKRSEDKATPAGVIVLADASTVQKEGTTEFAFTVGKLHHRFQANTSTERDSWIVALEKKIEEAKALKEDVTARESYKKTIEGFAVAGPGAAAAATRSSSKGPKKSLDAATATAAATEPTPVPETASAAPSDADKKEAENTAKKERSQSRKRASIFGMLGKKDDDKEVKKEEKAEKKVEKEQLKEEKKVEAEQKKEEAKATHESSKAVEAVEAAAVAAVPAAAITAAEKKEEKEEKKEDEVTTPTEKKNKRASVFGSLFSKKSAANPTVEKTEKDAAGPATSVKETEVPPVSETAPKLDEPIENKPIDTAAVTAPVDAVETPLATEAVAPVEESAKEVPAASTGEAVTSPKSEKKGGFLSGLIKKAEVKKEEKKEEAQEEKAAEQISKDPVVAAAATTEGTAEPQVEPQVPETTETKEERPAREKRRTSFFSSLGTIKKKNPEAGESEAPAADIKREKSPLPSRLGGMFRKPSKALKSPEAEKPAEGATEATETTEPASAAVAEPTESAIVGDVVPDELHATVHDAVTSAPTEVKASA